MASSILVSEADIRSCIDAQRHQLHAAVSAFEKGGQLQQALELEAFTQKALFGFTPAGLSVSSGKEMVPVCFRRAAPGCMYHSVLNGMSIHAAINAF